MVSKNEMWRDITKRAWDDPAFKERLVNDPASVLKDYGASLESGVSYRVVEDRPGLRHLVLMRPAGDVSVSDVSSDPMTDENPGF